MKMNKSSFAEIDCKKVCEMSEGLTDAKVSQKTGKERSLMLLKSQKILLFGVANIFMGRFVFSMM